MKCWLFGVTEHGCSAFIPYRCLALQCSTISLSVFWLRSSSNKYEFMLSKQAIKRHTKIYALVQNIITNESNLSNSDFSGAHLFTTLIPFWSPCARAFSLWNWILFFSLCSHIYIYRTCIYSTGYIYFWLTSVSEMQCHAPQILIVHICDASGYIYAYRMDCINSWKSKRQIVIGSLLPNCFSPLAHIQIDFEI